MWQDLTIWTKLGSRYHYEFARDGHVPALGKALLSLTSITRLDLGATLLPPMDASDTIFGIDNVVNSIVQLTTLR